MGDVFKALADPTRRTILDELTVRDGQTLFEICGRLATNHGLTSSRQAVSPDLHQSGGLQHVEVLRDRLGFVKKHDVPAGGARWLTVVSPDNPEGTELLLEPSGHPAAKPFRDALVADGIPFTMFTVDDVRAEYERLRSLGVRFTQEPTEMGPVTTAVFDDTCGNLIQIATPA
ncbi:VOC family protein [Amycolatopsis viridis]|uniref:Catechol 2,3-dioxygenase-like lactoylglutathione lyase family enzyme n=1 Tax=Amycolatopsis viridis TaxID=185678 RepID=A0ABX0T0U8_9PSEU|nr:VOC family protein [Amycolatopsis viridis]NIH82363.1 catechol 2,3-dioxygenase-like lactoylglutathione lyase family enzyme [Amycolatopsis viridis]